jgi:hypothetical protein
MWLPFNLEDFISLVIKLPQPNYQTKIRTLIGQWIRSFNHKGNINVAYWVATENAGIPNHLKGK